MWRSVTPAGYLDHFCLFAMKFYHCCNSPDLESSFEVVRYLVIWESLELTTLNVTVKENVQEDVFVSYKLDVSNSRSSK